jgi:hypothetical protein
LALFLWAPLFLISAPPSGGAQEENDDAAVPGWREEFMRRYELPRDFGHDWRLGGYMSLTQENGLVLGAGPILYEFGFRTFPYLYRMELLGGIALPSFRGKISYGLLMPAIANSLTLEGATHISQIESSRWYGLGNDSGHDIDLERDGAYDVLSREFSASVRVFWTLAPATQAGIGTSCALSTLNPANAEKVPGLFPAGFGDAKSYGGLGLLFRHDTRDDPVLPHGGVFLETGGWSFAGLKSGTKGFQRISGELRIFAGDTLFTDVMAALRIGAERVFGEFPSNHAASIGGANLRGFPFERFAGDASAYAGAEIRWSMGKWMIIVPMEIGMAIGFDAGRVWLKGASPGPWHTGLLAGIWSAPLSRELLMFGSVAQSSEGWELRAGVGMDF